jgi:1,2-dihydroxy-3-keto-5-methylthiopentene dioxygenase
MTLLVHYRDGDTPSIIERTRDGAKIARALGAVGVHFERWTADVALPADADQVAVLHAYAAPIAKLSAERGYPTSDVVRIRAGTPNTAPMREKFLAEHRHSEDEVRFFVEGTGTFYLRAPGDVFAVVCERGDLIGVPRDMRHWFDMGTQPFFCAIRLFTSTEGWVAQFTGDPIATRYPTHDALMSAS